MTLIKLNLVSLFVAGNILLIFKWFDYVQSLDVDNQDFLAVVPAIIWLTNAIFILTRWL